MKKNVEEQFYEIDLTEYDRDVILNLHSVVSLTKWVSGGWNKTIHNLEMMVDYKWDDYEGVYGKRIFLRLWTTPRNWQKFYRKEFVHIRRI